MISANLSSIFFSELAVPSSIDILTEKIRSLSVTPDAVFLGSSAGTAHRNTVFIRDYLQNGLQFASPRLFQDTSPASYLGHICRVLDKTIYAKAFGDGIWSFREAILYVTRHRGRSALYCTIEEGVYGGTGSLIGLCVLNAAIAAPLCLTDMRVIPETEIANTIDSVKELFIPDAIITDGHTHKLNTAITRGYPSVPSIQPHADYGAACSINRLFYWIACSQPFTLPASVLCAVSDSWGTTSLITLRALP